MMCFEKSSKARPVYRGSQSSTISFFVFMFIICRLENLRMEYLISFFSLFIITFAALKVRYYCRMTKKIAIENSRDMVEKLKEIRIEDYIYDLPTSGLPSSPWKTGRRRSC